MIGNAGRFPMNYHLSFNKNTAILIFAVGSVVGALLFFAGYRVGVDHGVHRAQAEFANQTGAMPLLQEANGASGSRGQEMQASASGGGESATISPGSSSAAASTEGFTVQIAAYQAEDAARQLRDRFNARGYSAFIFEGKDSAAQLWYAVRVGHFRELEPATRAAVNFTLREKLPAHVRPLNEL